MIASYVALPFPSPTRKVNQVFPQGISVSQNRSGCEWLVKITFLSDVLLSCSSRGEIKSLSDPDRKSVLDKQQDAS